MSIVYFDASALVKLFFEEAGSDLAADLWDGCDLAVTSRLTYPEVCAALAAAGRNHAASASDIAAAQRRWEMAWERIRVVELTPGLATEAGALARAHRLGGADAVHLASASLLAGDDVVVAAWDRRLHAGAVASGLAVAPSTLPPPASAPFSRKV